MGTRRAEFARFRQVLQRCRVISNLSVELPQIAMRHLIALSFINAIYPLATHPNAFLNHVVRVCLQLHLQLCSVRRVPRDSLIRPPRIELPNLKWIAQGATRVAVGLFVGIEEVLIQGWIARLVDVLQAELVGFGRYGWACDDDMDEPLDGRSSCMRICSFLIQLPRYGSPAHTCVVRDVAFEIERVGVVHRRDERLPVRLGS